MPPRNEQIASVLEEIADTLALTVANPFRAPSRWEPPSSKSSESSIFDRYRCVRAGKVSSASGSNEVYSRLNDSKILAHRV